MDQGFSSFNLFLILGGFRNLYYMDIKSVYIFVLMKYFETLESQIRICGHNDYMA